MYASVVPCKGDRLVGVGGVGGDVLQCGRAVGSRASVSAGGLVGMLPLLEPPGEDMTGMLREVGSRQKSASVERREHAREGERSWGAHHPFARPQRASHAHRRPPQPRPPIDSAAGSNSRVSQSCIRPWQCHLQKIAAKKPLSRRAAKSWAASSTRALMQARRATSLRLQGARG